jgi:hypothetical protein
LSAAGRRGVLSACAVGLASLLLASCASSGDEAGGDVGFPVEPYTSVSTEAGALSVAVRTSPEQPPSRGVVSVELTVTDPGGAPVDGLVVEPTLWMPAMGHGTSVTPTVSPAGKGRYVLTNVNLYMAGRWELRTRFSGAATDRAVPVLEVP